MGLTNGWSKSFSDFKSLDLVDRNLEISDIHQLNIHNDCSLWIDFIKVCGRTGPLFIFLFIFGMFIGYFEKWDTITTIYYCIVTMTTVGYGDVIPQTQSMRLVAVVFIP